MRYYLFLILVSVCTRLFAQSGSGTALDFAVGSSVPITTTGPSLSDVGFPFTIMFWMKVGNGPDVYPIISTSYTTTGYSGIAVDYRPANQSLQVTTGNNNTFTQGARRSMIATVGAVTNKWVHVAVTMTGATSGSVYINGASRTVSYSGSGSTPVFPAGNQTRIGNWLATFPRNYLGQMDELSVWSRTLSISEIRQNMCQKLKGTEANLEAYYNFDNTSSNIIIDRSPNGVDLAIPIVNTQVTRSISEAPVGDTSVYSYTIGNATLTSPSGVTLSAINGTGAPDGVHVYYIEDHPDQDVGIGALCDTIGHFGRFIATNPAQPNVPGRITISPAMSTILTRPKSNNGTWSTAPVTQVLFFSDIYREFLFDPGQFPFFDIDRIPACDSNTITAPFVFGGSYSWSTGQTTRTIFTPSIGEYWVTVTTNCASLTDTFTVYSDTAVDPLAFLDSTVYCQNDSVYVEAYPYANRPPIDSVVWDDGVTGIGRYISQDGWYGAHVLVNGRCWLYDSILVNSRTESFDLGNDTTICSGDQIVLSVPSTATNIVWSTGAVNTPSITVTSANVYSVQFELNSCPVSDVIVVSETVVIVQLQDDVAICEGESINIAYGTNVPVDGALWSTGETGPFITVQEEGEYWVTVSAGSCTASDTFALELLDGLTSVPDQVIETCGDEPALLTVFGVVPDSYVSSLVWNTGETGDSIYVTEEGRYTASGISPCGPFEVDFSVSSIQCDPIIYIPDAFSPNGDGLNDYFTIQIDGLKEFRFTIFDRWGNKVYETFDRNQGWDGGDLTDGVFVYKLVGTSFRGEPFEKSGTLSIIR